MQLEIAQSFESMLVQLNSAPAQHRWVYADSLLLQAIVRNKPVERGPRGRILHRMLCVADRVGLVGLVVLITGFIELIRLMRRQFAFRSPGGMWPERFFVGFGAGPEEALLVRYTEENVEPPGRLNQIDVATFGAWQKLSLISGLRVLWHAQHAVCDAVKALPKELCPRRLDFLTFAAMRLGVYSFMRAWFQQLQIRQSGLVELCFLSPDTPAFAAVDAGLPTRYLQHGLIRHSLILPGFDRIDALTSDEERHFRHRLPCARVYRAWYPEIWPEVRNAGILIASIYTNAQELALIEPLLDWALTQGYQLWVRPHPCDTHGFWARFQRSHRLRIEDTDASFIAALERLRPSFVVSWYSTALADALLCGIIPVTVSGPSTPTVQDMVYPLMDRALRWPVDREEMDNILRSPSDYRAVVNSLQELKNER